MLVYILLNCKPGTEKETITKICQIIKVDEINGIWGKYDIFLKVTIPDPMDIEEVVEKLRKVDNITSTYTMPALYGQGGTIDKDY